MIVKVVASDDELLELHLQVREPVQGKRFHVPGHARVRPGESWHGKTYEYWKAFVEKGATVVEVREDDVGDEWVIV